MSPRPSPWSTGSRTSPAAPGHPRRRRTEALLGEQADDSNLNRAELRKRRTVPVISRKGAPSSKGLGELRCVVEQTFALLHHCKRLAVRWERRTELRGAFVSLACSLICRRRLKKAHSRSGLELSATTHATHPELRQPLSE